MGTLRHRLVSHRRTVEYSCGAVLVALFVARFVTLHRHPIFDVIGIAFEGVAIALIVYEAAMRRAALLGGVGVVLVLFLWWPRVGSGNLLVATWVTMGAYVYLLARRPVEHAGQTTAEPAGEEPAGSGAEETERLPRVGDPNFRYLPPPK